MLLCLGQMLFILEEVCLAQEHTPIIPQQDEMLEAIDYAHIHGKQIYLTVNTLLKNKELYGQLYDFLAPYYQQGIDAVIVQDLGVLSFLKKEFPNFPIHASTQMAVTGARGSGAFKGSRSIQDCKRQESCL